MSSFWAFLATSLENKNLEKIQRSSLDSSEYYVGTQGCPFHICLHTFMFQNLLTRQVMEQWIEECHHDALNSKQPSGNAQVLSPHLASLRMRIGKIYGRDIQGKEGHIGNGDGPGNLGSKYPLPSVLEFSDSMKPPTWSPDPRDPSSSSLFIQSFPFLCEDNW